MLYIIMARMSKFKIGMDVKSVMNPEEVFEVISILRNDLVVRAKSNGEEYTARKNLFRLLEKEKSD